MKVQAGRARNRWKLVICTAEGPLEKKFRSQPAVYRAAEQVRVQVAAGTSAATEMEVHLWEVPFRRWVLFERLPVGEKT